MAILLLAEHDGASLSDQTAKALTAASKIGGDVHVLVAGASVQGAADAAAKLSGVAKVLVADAADYANRLAEPLADLIVSLSGAYDVIIAPATASAKNVMPRVAALLDVMQVSEIIEVVSADTFKRPIYAGNAIQTVQQLMPRKSSPCVPLPSRRHRKVARQRSKLFRRVAMPVSPPSWKTRSPRPTVRN